MVVTLSQLELAFLFWLSLCLLLLPWPVPRGWSLPALFLLMVQTGALMGIDGPGEVIVGGPDETPNRVDTFADTLGVYVVPALSGGLILVVMWYLARANAQVRRRAGTHTIGSDTPTGCGAAAGEGSCITGSSSGDRATSPRAA